MAMLISRIGPLPRAALTSTACMAVGDIACQCISQRQRSPKGIIRIDWARTARFGVIGFTLHGPFFFKGFQLLDTCLGKGTTFRDAAMKSLAGQFTLFPMYTSLVLMYASLLEGQGLQQGLAKVKDRLPNLFVAGSVYWPFVQMINFMYVPAARRVLAVNVAAMAWNVYLSYMTSSPVSAVPAGK